MRGKGLIEKEVELRMPSGVERGGGGEGERSINN